MAVQDVLDDFFVFGDLVYANLSDKGTTRGPIAESVKVKASSAIACVGYTIAHRDGGHADAMLDASDVSIDSTLGVSRASTVSASGSIDCFEPALVLGARHRLAEDW